VTRVQDRVEAPTELDAVWGLQPRFYETYMRIFNARVKAVDPLLFELCRLRMASLLGSELDLSLRYRPAIEAGLTEEKIAALSSYMTSPLFSDRERVCISFAEQFVIEASSLTDEDCAKVLRYLPADEFTSLTRALWASEQLQRTCVVFDIRPGSVAPSTMDGFVALPVMAEGQE
jgi:alkylhydroperoxidase family enzyme